MSNITKRLCAFFIAVIFVIPVFAQNSFRGNFLMSFTSSVEKSKPIYPLLWNVEPGRMVMEIEDNMKSKGVSKRVIFNTADSTWIMAMEFGNIKQGTRIHAASMYRDSGEQKKVSIKSIKFQKQVEGFNCHQVIVSTAQYISKLWVTDEIDFNICRIYKLLSHCGMMSDFVEKGDWYFMKKNKGMIMEVVSTDLLTGEIHTMKVTQLSQDNVNQSMFNITNYKISDIPEGQHCGPVTQEK
jgi:hypothetical protein